MKKSRRDFIKRQGERVRILMFSIANTTSFNDLNIFPNFGLKKKILELNFRVKKNKKSHLTMGYYFPFFLKKGLG